MSVKTVYICVLCGNRLVVEGRSRWPEGWSKMQKFDADYNLLAEMDICSRDECSTRANAQSMDLPEFLRRIEAQS